MKFINIEKNKIPYEFEIALKNGVFQFEVFYNSAGDFFTLNVSKDHERILNGEKLVYGVPLFENTGYLDLPADFIIPYDITRPELKHSDRISWESLNEDIFLYVIEEGDFDD